ncbi:small cysteine-rich protein 8-like [Oculina patagonica]
MGSTFYLCLLLIMLGSITVQGAPPQKENPMNIRSKQDKQELTLKARAHCLGPCSKFINGRCHHVYDCIGLRANKAS